MRNNSCREVEGSIYLSVRTIPELTTHHTGTESSLPETLCAGYRSTGHAERLLRWSSFLSFSPRLRFNESGSALVMVVALAVICNILLASFFFSSRLTTKKSGHRREYVTILNIAEAGKEDGISKYRFGGIQPQPATKTVVAADDNFSGGSYAVTCSTNSTLDTMWMVSRAEYQGRTRSIEVVYKITTCSPTGAAFDKGICVGGDISWTGSGSLTAGTVTLHCNGSFTMSGSSSITASVDACNGIDKSGSCDINGDVRSLYVSQSGSGSITGSITEGSVPPVAIPIIDWTLYHDHAASESQVYTGDQHVHNSSDYTVPGGIMWVDGDFKKSGSGAFNGCVIATGTISVAGSGDWHKVNSYPAAVSINGDIDFSGSGDVYGLLYAQNGNFEKTGSGNVTGSIVCLGDFKKSGSWDFLSYVKSLPVAPGCTSNNYRKISWRELN